MVSRAGLPNEDMEFVQFHPTGIRNEIFTVKCMVFVLNGLIESNGPIVDNILKKVGIGKFITTSLKSILKLVKLQSLVAKRCQTWKM